MDSDVIAMGNGKRLSKDARAVTAVEKAWNRVLLQVTRRSYTHIGKAVRSYSDARATVSFGKADVVTRNFCEAVLWHAKRREWGDIEALIGEYKGIIRYDHVRDEKICASCGKAYRPGAWKCSRISCHTRRHLIDVARVDTDQARVTLAWNDWREGVKSMKPLARAHDGAALRKISLRIVALVKIEFETKHVALDNFVDAIEWMVSHEKYKEMWQLVKKMNLIFHEIDTESICGRLLTTCVNRNCAYRYPAREDGDGDAVDIPWVCPECGVTRGVCMDSFTGVKGRCHRHKGTTSYYGFVNVDIESAYERYLHDPDLVSTQRQIALLDLRVTQLTSSMDGVSGADVRRVIDRAFDDLEETGAELAEVLDDDEPDADELEAIAVKLLKTMVAIRKVANKSDIERVNWTEIRGLLTDRAKQVDSEVRKQIAQQYTIPINTYIQGLTELAAMFVTRLSIIEDQGVQARIRKLVTADAQRLLTAETIDGQFTMVNEDVDVVNERVREDVHNAYMEKKNAKPE